MIHQHTWDTYEKTVSKCGTLATEVSDIVIIHWRISKSYHMITSDSQSPTSGSISPSLPLYGLISNFTSGCVPHPRDLPHDRGRGWFSHPTRKFPLYRRELIKRHPRFTQGTLQELRGTYHPRSGGRIIDEALF